jgi:hypothetical protein
MYKVRDSFNDTLYEVYCHFDSDGAWTLVQSFSFAERINANSVLGKSLYEDHPVSEKVLTWSGYRLSQAKMKSINKNSDQLRFTCGFEKEQDVNQTDYLQMSLDEEQLKKYITSSSKEENEISASNYSGKINERDLKGCKIKLHQDDNDEGFHVHIDKGVGEACTTFKAAAAELSENECKHFRYFSYYGSSQQCLLQTHNCTKKNTSTSQLWFGKKP